MSKRPLIVAIEGVKGSGKTTVIDRVRRSLEASGMTVHVHQWRPVRPVFAQVQWRDYLEQTNAAMTRYQSNVNADVVILDRFPPVSEQAHNPMMIEQVRRYAGAWPDLLLVLQCDPMEAYARLHTRKRDGEATLSLHDVRGLNARYCAMNLSCLSLPVRYLNTTEGTLTASGDARQLIMAMMKAQLEVTT